ncbi:hypothetical protein cje154_05324, partial [Campylobacter jejuni subsp. jejuni 2008-988]
KIKILYYEALKKYVKIQIFIFCKEDNERNSYH